MKKVGYKTRNMGGSKLVADPKLGGVEQAGKAVAGGGWRHKETSNGFTRWRFPLAVSDLFGNIFIQI